MSTVKLLPTRQDILVDWSEYFEYDIASPTFLTNKITRSPKAQKGQPSGCVSAKEIKTRFKGYFFRNARIVWELHNGEIPDEMLMGFRDGNEMNLSIDNLFLQSRRGKGVNGKHRLGTSGIRGVRETDSGKWMAHIKLNGKTVYLGTYPTPEEAIQARINAIKVARRFE